MHAETPKELRKLSGAGESLAARIAGVSRETIRAYEVDPRLVKTPAKRWLCEMYYADIATRIALARERARIVDDGMFPEDGEPMPVVELPAALMTAA